MHLKLRKFYVGVFFHLRLDDKTVSRNALSRFNAKLSSPRPRGQQGDVLATRARAAPLQPPGGHEGQRPAQVRQDGLGEGQGKVDGDAVHGQQADRAGDQRVGRHQQERRVVQVCVVFHHAHMYNLSSFM